MPLPQAILTLRNRLRRGPLKSGTFVHNVLTILAGTALSQIIALAAIPILARIFSPDDFGALATYMAFASILAVAANLSYQAAIILRKRDESAFTLLICCMLISLVMSFACGLVRSPEINEE